MPCDDITEVLEVTLDAQDRLADYAFLKRSCGQGVGAASLLIDQLHGRSLDELLALEAETFLAEFPPMLEIEEFLTLKHMFAIQGALEVLTGKEPGRKDDAFAASDIAYSEDETIITGLIAIDIMTEKIKACGGCKGCGTKRAKRDSLATATN